MRKARPALIGAFVLGAFTLAVIGFVAFSSGQLFHQTFEFVLYFDKSVNGLSVGAPVKFLGVEIGSVKQILLRFDPQESRYLIPVVIDIDPEKTNRSGPQTLDMSDRAHAEKLVQEGLRGQLQSQSFVTGILFVQLSFQPNTPIRRIQPTDDGLLEIPTVPTVFEEVTEAVSKLVSDLRQIDFQKLTRSFEETATSIGDFARSEDLKQTVTALKAATDRVTETMESVSRLSRNVDAKVPAITSTLEASAADLRRTLDAARSTLDNVQPIFAPESPVVVEIRSTLADLSSAAHSMREFIELLQRTPNAVIVGRDDMSPIKERPQ